MYVSAATEAPLVARAADDREPVGRRYDPPVPLDDDALGELLDGLGIGLDLNPVAPEVEPLLDGLIRQAPRASMPTWATWRRRKTISGATSSSGSGRSSWLTPSPARRWTESVARSLHVHLGDGSA